MAHMTPGEEAALNEVMQMLEAEPVESTTSSANPLVSVTNDDNVRSWQFLFRLENRKKPSVCSSHMIRLNAFPTRMFRNTPKGMKPTLATRQLRLWLTASSCFTARLLESWFRLTM